MMKTSQIEESVRSWIVPPACAGQIVEVAYGSDYDGLLYRRITDRSDGSIGYAVADADDVATWDPANEEPSDIEWTEVAS